MSEVMDLVEEKAAPVEHPARGTVLRIENGRDSAIHVVANGRGGTWTVSFPSITGLALEKLAASRLPAGASLSYNYRPMLSEDGLRVTAVLGSGGFGSGDEYLFLREAQADEVLRRLAMRYVRTTLRRDQALTVEKDTEAAFVAAEREFKTAYFSTIGAFRAAQGALENARAVASHAHAAVSELEAELALLKQDFVRVAPQGMTLGIPVKVGGATYGVRGAAGKSDNYEGPDWLRMHLSVFVIDPAAD